MVYSANVPRPIVLKASRETIALVIGATAATFALSNAIHAHRGLAPSSETNRQAVALEQDWTGQLADVAPKEVLASSAPFNSASLVVPRSELALPRMPVRPLVKLHGCEGSACVSRPAIAPTQRHPVAGSQRDDRLVGLSVDELAPVRSLLQRETPHVKPSFMSRMNPLNHLPDLATIKRPFAYEGDTVTGLFKRF